MLPVMNSSDLKMLYGVDGQRSQRATSATHWRPVAQSAFIMKIGFGVTLEGEHAMAAPSMSHLNLSTLQSTHRSLTLVEMGCARGHLLYNLRKLARNGGRLVCFEVDSFMYGELLETFALARNDTPGLQTSVVRGLLDFKLLAPSSVDIFLSSHVLEHIPDVCSWLSGLKSALKPGGLVFTEVPKQSKDPEAHIVRGFGHVMFFDEHSLRWLFLNAGFEEIYVALDEGRTHRQGVVIRSLFRNPS
eukprot:gnl/MRDRNA2_/MRDRNA2_205014_c0_seq1.p1 gnl/MRDRNA2_/MRDRNA2_205014_c0~~gnl/MRDRNA2_/MRDRNA2_205014_c0_seq1.p1  ORF type:complete len:263 (-),score=33.76 gnl/MRDRNA2_/MRDRNA2_205014_c0_seq1:387-1121(-)